MIKVKIKMGVSEIDLEGEAAEIHEILKRHWEPHVDLLLSTATRDAREPVNGAGDVKPSPASKGPVRKARSSKAASAKSADGAADFEQTLANSIKGAQNYNLLSNKFITANPALVERCKLVLSFSEKPLTSGDVLRVLTNLGIRTNASAVSKALSNNKTQFITTGNPICYKMSAHTEKLFEESLVETPSKP